MQEQTTNQELASSTQRPVPLRKRSDLEIAQIDYKSVLYPVIKDPVGLKYYRLQPEQFEILLLLDGKLSLEELRDNVLLSFPTLNLTVADVQRSVIDLHEKGLLFSERLGQGELLSRRHSKERWKKVRQTLMNPLFLRLPGWDPEKTLQRIEPWLGWMFSKSAGLFFSILVVSSWLFIAMQFDEIRQRLPEFQQFFGWPNLMYLWATLAMGKILHEFGHGIACKHFGAECHSMGIMLLVFSPTLYCDVTDSWMLKSKWKRIIIGAAGMYVEIILAAVAILVWYHTQPGLINHLALNIFFISTATTVIFNANPLLRYDGYYIMADWLEIPNLRSKATKQLSQTVAWWGFGIEAPDDPFMPKSGRGWFILYATASALYRWFVLFAITFFLYTVLKPYRLQSIGIMLAVASLTSIFIGQGINIYKMLKAPKQDPISKLKVTVSCLLLGSFLAAFFLVKFPWYREASFYVEPVDVEHVYTTVPGFVEQIHVHPGQQVDAQAPLLTLRSPELLDRQKELLVEQDVRALEPKMYQELRDPDGKQLAEKSLESINEQLSDIQEQLQRTTIYARVSGTVIAPPSQSRPSIMKLKKSLSRGFKTPIDESSLDAFLQERTHVCSIAPTQNFHCILLIKQADLNDVVKGGEVRMKFDLFPADVWEGEVVEFSSRELEYAPPALSNKYGGPLATVGDTEGREKLATPVYQAIVEFEQQPESLCTGLRGRARFVVAERTLFGWFWRWFRETFHFRL